MSDKAVSIAGQLKEMHLLAKREKFDITKTLFEKVQIQLQVAPR